MMTCRGLMHVHVSIASEGESVDDCIRLMRRERTSYAIVLDGRGDALGVAVLDELSRRAPPGSHLRHAQVGSLCANPVVTCQPDDSIEVLAHVMAAARARIALVAERHTVLGILTVDDVLAARLRLAAASGGRRGEWAGGA